MKPADTAALQRIHAAATMSSYGQTLTWLRPILEDPATPLEAVEWTLVAVEDHDDDAILGYVAVTARHIENLYIDPPAQGRGVGAALLAAIGERVAGTITLRCLLHNPNARRFYERHGYAVARVERIVYHGQELDAWFMQKP
jgi:GNAT superfamily N-acetyltransferase